MQGIFINGARPKFKKDVIAYVAGINLYNEHGGDPGAISALRDLHNQDNPDFPIPPQDPYGLVIEATSLFGNEFDGSLSQAMTSTHKLRHGPFYIVGPDPRTSRKWYLTITYNTDTHEWEVS